MTNFKQKTLFYISVKYLNNQNWQCHIIDEIKPSGRVYQRNMPNQQTLRIKSRIHHLFKW